MCSTAQGTEIRLHCQQDALPAPFLIALGLMQNPKISFSIFQTAHFALVILSQRAKFGLWRVHNLQPFTSSASIEEFFLQTFQSLNFTSTFSSTHYILHLVRQNVDIMFNYFHFCFVTEFASCRVKTFWFKSPNTSEIVCMYM